MGTTSESQWSRGWIPSESDKGNFGEGPRGLLRMDNLNIDEKGILRLAKSSTPESDSAFSTSNSIYGAYITSKKYRYVYTNGGALLRNYNVAGLNTQSDFGLTIFTGATTTRCQFLNALGQVLIAAGSKKYKDNGTTQQILGIAAGAAPVLTINAAVTVAVDNKDGSAHYSNWSSIESSAIDGTSTYLSFTTNTTTDRSAVKTVFAATLDTTNLGGTGKDSPDDLLKFNVYIDDPSKVLWVQIEFCGEAVTGSAVLPDVLNYYLHFWDAQATDGPYKWFAASPGAWTPVEVRRDDFQRFGVDSTKTWANIKSIRFIVGCVGTVNFRFNDMYFQGGDTGPLDGEFKYVGVEVMDTGDYVEFGIASAIATATAHHASIHVNRSGTAVGSNANGIWYFRQSELTGDYLAVHREYGAVGFTPAAFDDALSDDDAIASAAADAQFTIEPYRTALGTDVLGMIWFRDRVIYLTGDGFVPSFKLDPGSYDSRFVYEVVGSVSEKCLFIVKLDVGTFIVATTRDFYRVTGTFANSLLPNGVTIQDVNIYPLGVTDPAISSSFVEVDGSIMYMSSTGIRSLSNSSSSLINGQLDLLFRGETRYNIPAVAVSPADASFIACASQGNRIYWSIPTTEGTSKPRVYVMTLDPSGITWRLWSEQSTLNNPRNMFREEDGTIIYTANGSGLNYLRTLETGSTTLSYHLLTQYNYCNSPNARKDPTSLALFLDSGGSTINIIIYGLQEDGSIITKVYSTSPRTAQLIYFDIKEHLDPCIAFAFEIYGTSSTFKFQYYILEYQPRATLVRRQIQLSKPFNGKLARRAITAWPFVINPLGGEVTARVFADGTLVPNDTLTTQTFMGAMTETFEWTTVITTMAVDWEIELVGTREFEFYEFLHPIISQENPTPVQRVKLSYTPLESAGRKTLATWPFRLNTMGGTVSVQVRADGNDIGAAQTFSGADIIQVVFWKTVLATRAVAWEIELTSTTVFEFYEFLRPEITETCPVPVFRVIQRSSDLGKPVRKRVDTWPFRINPLSGNLTLNVAIDNSAQDAQSLTGLLADGIETLFWKNIDNVVGRDFEFEIIGTAAFEFYGFEHPIITEEFPPITYYAIMSYTNFGKAVKKKIPNIPFMANTFGHTVTLTLSTDGNVLTTTNSFNDAVNSIDIRTLFWHNDKDIAAIDWQLEIAAPLGMEFYQFMKPDVIQLFPIGRLIDQVGPFDLDAQGLIYAMRVRIMCDTDTFHFKIYDADEIIHEGDLTVEIGKDQVQTEKFPKGITPSVCKIALTSDNFMYRFSVELLVRTTGKETEGRWVNVG